MPLNYKQIFDALSYSVRNGNTQPINVYQALMTAEGVGVLAGYHMRKTRKQMLAATELFYEQRDDILTKHGFTIKNEELVPVTGEKDEDALKAALAEIDTLSKQMRSLPSGDAMDAGFRRLRYCRYADDFLIGAYRTGPTDPGSTAGSGRSRRRCS